MLLLDLPGSPSNTPYHGLSLHPIATATFLPGLHYSAGLISCDAKARGIWRLTRSSRIIAPKGRDKSPATIDTAHCTPFSRVIEKAVPPTLMIKTCPPIVIRVMPINNQFLWIPANTFNLLSILRQLT